MPFLNTLETNITTAFVGTAATYGGTLLAAFRPAFVAGFGIWISLIAYEVAFGKSEDGFTYIFTKIGKVFLIGTFALLGWPELNETFLGIKEGFVPTGTISTVIETNLIAPMEKIWVDMWIWFGGNYATLNFYELGEIANLFFAFLVLIIAYASMALVVGLFGSVALAMFLVANSIFVLLLAMGPFFLLCLAFPFTQRFFESFVGSVMTALIAMGFTVVMINFVSTYFGLSPTNPIFSTTYNSAAAVSDASSVGAFFAARFVTVLLLIYIYYKIFDLAAALGGGLNMGNNMIGGVRSIMRDLQKSGGAGTSSNSNTNQISQGGGGGGAPARAAGGNRTLTGMGVSAVGSVGGAAAGAAAAGARNLGSMASYGAGRALGAGTAAYNRYSQSKNRISK